ncbi:hypothetical protein [uncultured Sunxiuqinia sp.]|uniref:hypothetical protein n=1 Tax=uncultured Sunxiuqinia sp. TaxID=1573825 RepID=UPI002638146D|nr:hypothetical protein [uncultured Sunxiuqinia sp.]
MKKLFIALTLVILGTTAFSQSYKAWDEHDVVRFYEKVELASYSLDEDGEEINEVYVPTKVKDGVYEVEVRKISSKLYQIVGTSIYMYFRYSPYLHTYDDGILEVSYSSGTFYENPD